MRIAIACALALVAGNLPAFAQPDEADRPWAANVDPRDQQAALGLFREGNVYFGKNEYATAVTYYRKALAAWKHPAIHGNLAVALINLEQPLPAFEHLQEALRWGPTPLDPGIYQQLLTNQRLLHTQLARIEVACPVPIEVTLDGSPISCASPPRYALAGSHQVVARRTGYVTFAKTFTAPAGRETRISITMMPLADAGVYERRYREWVPWTVAGAGTAVVLLGVVLKASADSNIRAYDAEIDRSCPNGCPESELPQAVRDLQTRATLESRLAISSFIVGGSALAIGVTLLYLNQPRYVGVDSEGRRLSIRPGVGPGRAWVDATLRF